ncbi:MAG: polysaccharide deacetylase family protein [Gemmataceae bacterium]
MRLLSFASLVLLAPAALAQGKDGNRLAYLDELNLYYPSHTFPKLITPQWVGEKGVDAVVILAIDDMRDPKKYEAYLRPILDRLKKIDGRAPVSIMTCKVEPDDPRLQDFLKEGLSLECHTVEHPCPFFKNGFKRARATYDECVDLIHAIPGNKPVAFRMPCCDSLNTPSPRFFAEIFNKVTEKKRFLSLDSSVFMVYTSKDPELPKELTLDEDGVERFKAYFPADRSFVNWIENYPYPYMIGRQCWEFPCMTPSDWQAQHRHKPFNPQTVRDWKAALDCTVIKKGVFSMVFHPHGWIKAEQVVELIDYAVEKYGKRVKFLTFKEAAERLEKNLQQTPFRFEIGGIHNALLEENGLFLLDIDQDGFLDVVVGPRSIGRLWDNKKAEWKETTFPFKFPDSKDGFATVHFGLFGKGLSALDLMFSKAKGWDFRDGAWVTNRDFEKKDVRITREWFDGEDRGWRLLDLEGTGSSQLLYVNEKKTVMGFTPGKGWCALPFELPVAPFQHDYRQGRSGIVFHDLDGDGKLDLIFSNEKEYGIYLFADMKTGWSRKVLAGKRGDKDELPMISRNGTNNGFWIHSGQLWWSNEDTVLLRDHVDRRSIVELLKAAKKHE